MENFDKTKLNVWQIEYHKVKDDQYDHYECYSGVYYFKLKETLFYLSFYVNLDFKKEEYIVRGSVYHHEDVSYSFPYDVEDCIKHRAKENSIMGYFMAAEEVVQLEAPEFYDELMKIKSEHDYISLEEWNDLHVESFTREMPEGSRGPWWDWKEIAEYGRDTEHRWRLKETCPECGTRLVETYYSTPGWTWEMLMGRGGTLTFCPHCQNQLRFDLKIMN